MGRLGLPIRCSLAGFKAGLTLFVKDVLLKPEEGNQLGQEVVLCEERLGLMGVERLEILLGYVGLLLSLLDVVLLEHCVLDEVRVGDVVEDGIT